jgi:3-hydroxybutyryl-CoA dehydrogenase
MQNVAIIGAGIMGRGIAQVAAAAGFRVKVFDLSLEKAQEAVQLATAMLRRAAEKGQLSNAALQQAESQMQACVDLEELRGSELVIEAAAEDLQVKQGLLRKLEELLGEGTILATNTSSLSITQIASACRRPERVAGLHFFNPVPLMKLVEIIPGEITAQEVVGELARFVECLGHASVRAADTPGFLVNHAGRAFYTEGVRILSEGIASVFEIDRVARDALGFRMGPFELFDHTGLDVSYNVLTQIYHQFFEEPRFRPHPLLTRQYSAGLFGKKSGRGFYRYEGGARVDPADPPFEGGRERAVWISASVEDKVRLRSLLEECGVRIDAGEAAGADSVVLIAPRGLDATSSALAAELPLERTVAIDAFVWPVSRLTIMPSVATRPDIIDSLRGMLVRGGRSVTRIHESPGFVAQRMLAGIVNLACEIAQQRIASPTDIDRAVRLGLGYPKGPLAWGDELGPARVLDVLENLHSAYGDPRYRPSPWLKRRAHACLSLLTPDK